MSTQSAVPPQAVQLTGCQRIRGKSAGRLLRRPGKIHV